ncbi:methyltransferase domain-containing protein [Patulibacter brassicae]|jgi:predicted TPR repeat methyltransferase|uniref:Methyltransferase domain-containing protein n=1 Tax=Patulibacter brassicae TaxID=1705717 RepID=A0ABU4VFE9_9ACTN|nr:methyltransferase domain-containing protein [Patulibacter brassicae]MDX8150523.1 methyltransferase domain-containing protein [Patulibacter brassicae]
MSVPHPHSPADELTLRLPRTEARRAELDQDEEWCELLRPDGVERIRFHDYDRIFEIPGLYERLFYDELECCSPTVVREMLEHGIRGEGADPTSLSVLDLGAGNGMVGEELRDLGVAEIVGVDILPEARMATERDRPGVYADYRVCDLTDPPAADDDALRALAPDCLTTVAALGFGDIPPEAFATAFDYLAEDGWVALTIRDDFVTDEDPSGFARLLRRLDAEGALEVSAERRYQHRLAVSGEPLHYHAYVARKRGELDPSWVAAAAQLDPA